MKSTLYCSCCTSQADESIYEARTFFNWAWSPLRTKPLNVTFLTFPSLIVPNEETSSRGQITAAWQSCAAGGSTAPHIWGVLSTSLQQPSHTLSVSHLAAKETFSEHHNQHMPIRSCSEHSILDLPCFIVSRWPSERSWRSYLLWAISWTEHCTHNLHYRQRSLKLPPQGHALLWEELLECERLAPGITNSRNCYHTLTITRAFATLPANILTARKLTAKTKMLKA